MRKTMIATTVFVVACYLTILFDDTSLCRKHVSVQWSQEEGACSMFYVPDPFILNLTVNLACYLAVYAVLVVLLARGVLNQVFNGRGAHFHPWCAHYRLKYSAVYNNAQGRNWTGKSCL
jgi:hypothetical protein